ncbi:glutathione S-transferase-like protein [Novosphingobium aromaticivorans DSM 12444]|uniref:Glutathione S-transferase-like protein n=1 Tax=Novosphingobium aromaticivorans (strain ATCC 700278 / DSM 12444 / CCUG 56034 / CIP 105152 / NBRC 16084 / F199) TaxID=279238 RepID=Q2G498_NOVAD|nr:glutathione S-transferase family protein [Novosphingobium aromaticivorans]ABD27325.1 glutathione S-transferase-like protein [Novosphingobium aromaticivorans DSM 12444]SCY67041.1 glutathione S-transferase [Novosphingobium aromaticivorans]
MALFTLFTNPMSRGQIARWALHEVAADYETVLVGWEAKPKGLLEANPMAKVPTLVHHAPQGDRVVTETAAICLYLAEVLPESGLGPQGDELADYLRWTFFAAGPVEQAVTARNLGFEPKEPRQQGMAGFGSYDRTVDALAGHLAENAFVCGERFTMADVYVGSHVDWGVGFKSLPERPEFIAYLERVRDRPAYRAAKAVDGKLIAEMQA